MDTAAVEVTGLKRLMDSLKRKAQVSDVELRKALTEAAELVAGEAKRNVKRSPRGGRVYTKYNPKRVHWASAPYVPAADDTGDLATSVTTKIDVSTMTAMVVCASNVAPHAIVMEFGTADGKIKPRPFMRPAFYAKKNQAQALIKAAIDRAIKES